MVNHTTGVPGKPGIPVHSESPQKAAVDNHASSANIPRSNSILSEQLSGKAVTSQGEHNVYTGKLFMEAAASLGFPKDALSVALLVFARFFSLSADKALIGSLRREVLDLLKTSSPGTAEEKAALEARAMAAIIASDKGVFLSSGALEHYARFLMPKSFMTTASEEKETSSFKGPASSQDSREKPLEEIPEPDELKAIAETQTQEDGFLDLLNYLPGKNGQHWLVFPFSINVRGIELKVLLRVLRSERGSIPGRVSTAEDGQLIADISGPKRQWRCFLNKTAGKYRADIRVYPEFPQVALNHLRKQAARFLEKGVGLPWSKNSENFNGFEEIIVRNGDRIPLWAEDLWPDHLPFVDEEV